MKHNATRFLSLLLALVMVIGLMPVGHVHAEEEIFHVIGDQVTTVEANGTYVICIAGTKNALSNQQGSGSWGTHTLATGACDKIADARILWTLESAEGGYKLKNESGYLNISRNTASLNETGHIFELVYHENGGWAIKSLETNEYGNNLGNSGSIGGWSGDGTKFDLYTVNQATAEEVDPFGKLRGFWSKVSVDTETSYDWKEGLFEYAFDSNPTTIWHSNWQGASDKLTGENTFAGVIDFGAVYTINQFSFTPRQDNNSGIVTQASLYVKETEEAEWVLVAEHATFAADQSKKDMDFEAQAVRYVKFVAEQSSDGWVAVSEFDVAYNAPAAHEHSYEAVVTAPTCTEGGYTTYTCACGDTYIADETEALGHTPVAIPGYPADCENPGMTDGSYCSVCDETITAQEVIPATGHAFGEWTETKAPTCTEDGQESRSCANCDETETRSVAKLGHKYEAVVTAPTCTEGGYTTYTCACGDTYVADETEALGHSYEAVVTAPTCTEGGYTTYTCATCGDSYVADETEALGHNDGPIVVENEKPSTCTEGGYYDAVCYCTVCGVETYRSHIVVGPDGHFPTVFPGYPATCTEPGLTDGMRCGVCLEWIEPQEEIPALGHTAVVIPGYPATCEAPGMTDGSYCSVCDVTITAQEVIPATGHTPVVIPGYPATCEAPGMTDGSYCSVCDATITAQEVIPATGHTPVVIPGYPATCEAPGMTDGSYCSVCDATITAQEVIPATGHTPVVIPGYPATCEAPGMTDGSYCSVCDATITAQEVIPATGHTPVVIPGYPATCEAPGMTDGAYCSVCDATITAQEVIPATGHTPVVIPGYPATCEAPGMTDGSYCSVCDATITKQEVIPALGHSYENGSCVNCGAADPSFNAVIATGWSGYTTWTLTADGVLTFVPSGEKLENGETNLKNYWKVDGVLSLPWGEYAERITKVVVSEGIHDIGQMAFYELPNLVEVQLPSTIVEIRGYAFKNCAKLTTINLENVDFIREGAFYGCAALENVNFLTGVVIEDWAFSKTPVVLP